MLNGKGGIEAEVTILHVGADRFVMISGSAFGVRDSSWVRRQLPEGSPVRITGVTSASAVINVVGPKSRDVLQSVSDDDWSNDAIPFLSVKNTEVGLVPVRAVRVGYVGELGYELHVATEYAAQLYETVKAAGQAFDIRDVGYRAIETCRLEKGYAYWSAEIGPDYDPISAGLKFAVAMDKDFIGRETLQRVLHDGPRRQLCQLTIDGFAPLLSGETILNGGEVVGATSSCGFGHTIGKTIAFAWLPAELASVTKFEIEAFGTHYTAHRAEIGSLYDAPNERLLS